MVVHDIKGKKSDIFGVEVEVFRLFEKPDKIFYLVKGVNQKTMLFKQLVVIEVFFDPISALDFADALRLQILNGVDVSEEGRCD